MKPSRFCYVGMGACAFGTATLSGDASGFSAFLLAVFSALALILDWNDA